MGKKLLQLINQDLPVCSEPFLKLAGSMHKAKLLIKKIKELKKKKIITVYNAKIDQKKTGYHNNAMVAWKVAVKDADDAAKIVIKYPEISHCYLRKLRREFPYNFYTMIHAKTKKELDGVIKDIIRKTGLKDFVELKSIKEFKKSKQMI